MGQILEMAKPTEELERADAAEVLKLMKIKHSETRIFLQKKTGTTSYSSAGDCVKNVVEIIIGSL